MASKLCPFCMRMADSEICPHCGKNIDYAGSPTHLPAGFVVHGKHPYVMGAALGQGGFGITYIALDMVSGERVAIKEYFPTFCCARTSGTISAYPNQEEVFQKGRDRFLDEARVLKSLSDLKSIVNVLDYFEFNNSAYLVMEFLDGTSLKDHVAKNGKFPAQAFLRQILPLMEDIERMHQRGVVHRDIAPDNIILLPDGQMKLIDFGAARSFVGDKSMTVVVKKGLAPVEQYLTKGVTAATDVYALAATMYYCITGIVPLDSAERQYDGTPLQSPSILGTSLAPSQEKALENALAIMQKERTQTVQEFVEQLNAKAPTPKPELKPKPESKPQPDKKKTFLALLGAIGTATVLIIFCFLFPGESPEKPLTVAPLDTIYQDASELESTESVLTSTCTLMSDALDVTLTTKEDGASFSVFGSKYRRNQIRSISLLPSTKDAADSWDVSQNQDGTVLAWVKPNGGLYDLYIGAEGGIRAPENCSDLFAAYSNLEQINFNNAFDTANVTNMMCMFACSTELTELDLSSFDTALVTIMQAMFFNCKSLNELDLSGFDTANVTNMLSMFLCCQNLTELNVSSFNTTRVTNMTNMFYNCNRLAELDISNFDVSNVESYQSFMNGGQTINGRPWKEFFTRDSTSENDSLNLIN